MDKMKTIQWIVTAVLRLVAGYVAVKYGDKFITEQTWEALAQSAGGLIVGGLSIYSSIKARKTLLAQEPPKPPTGASG